MHSSAASCPHLNAVRQMSHGSSPLSSPTSAISYDASSTSSVAAATDDERSPSDVAFALRFGDIPASSFASGSAHGSLMQGPPGPLVGTTADTIPKASEVKLLNRSQSKLGRRSTSPIRGGSRAPEQLEQGLSSDQGIDYHDMCCSASGSAGGHCSSASCMVSSPRLPEALLAFQKFLPSNDVMDDDDVDEEELWSATDSWPALDVYSCDDFRMYEFKVRKCVRGRSHDWTECPFAHPGEKARRRDPRRYRYTGTACPDFRKGNCRRGEACEFSHGVFECWLHPTRYRTQPCKDGKSCRRRVCFFAHTPEQLRVVLPEGTESPPTTPGSGSSSGSSARSSLLKAAALSGGAYDGSPLRRALAGTLDGSMALELFLDDASSKSSSAAACHHHHHHHWIGMGSSPSSTLVGLSVGATSPSPISSPVLSPVSPLVSSSSSWAGVPAHRRHLDRLRSVPTISIPAAEDSGDSPPSQRSPCTMAELMSTLQSLQISPGPLAVQSCRPLPSSGGWPLLSAQPQQAPSQSAPNTPKSGYLQVNRMRMERSVAMAAATLSVSTAMNEAPVVDSDVTPDLDWVNELVQ